MLYEIEPASFLAINVQHVEWPIPVLEIKKNSGKIIIKYGCPEHFLSHMTGQPLISSTAIQNIQHHMLHCLTFCITSVATFVDQQIVLIIYVYYCLKYFDPLTSACFLIASLN